MNNLMPVLFWKDWHLSYTRAYLDIFDGIVSEMIKKWTQNDKDCVKFVAGCVNYEKCV